MANDPPAPGNRKRRASCRTAYRGWGRKPEAVTRLDLHDRILRTDGRQTGWSHEFLGGRGCQSQFTPTRRQYVVDPRQRPALANAVGGGNLQSAKWGVADARRDCPDSGSERTWPAMSWPDPGQHHLGRQPVQMGQHRGAIALHVGQPFVRHAGGQANVELRTQRRATSS